MPSKAIGALTVLDQSRNVSETISGSYVQLSTHLFFLTCSHSVTWKKLLDNNPEYPLEFRFVGIDNTEFWDIIVPKAYLKIIDLRELEKLSLRMHQLDESENFTSRDLELYDLALISIKAPYDSYIINKGTVPFTSKDFSKSDEQWKSLYDTCVASYFVGTPLKLFDFDASSGLFRIQFKVFQVEPTGTSDSEEGNSSLNADNFFFWLRPLWRSDHFEGSISGTSGSALIVESPDDFALCAVQCLQYPDGRFPERIGFCAVQYALEHAERILSD